MQRRVHPIIITLVVLIAAAVIVMVYTRKMEKPRPFRPSGSGPFTRSAKGQAGAPVPGQPTPWIVGKLDASSPLRAIGLQEGDTVLSVNDQQQMIESGLAEAIERLQTTGTPIRIVFHRHSPERHTITWTKKLPGNLVLPKPQAPPAPAGGK